MALVFKIMEKTLRNSIGGKKGYLFFGFLVKMLCMYLYVCKVNVIVMCRILWTTKIQERRKPGEEVQTYSSHSEGLFQGNISKNNSNNSDGNFLSVYGMSNMLNALDTLSHFTFTASHRGGYCSHFTDQVMRQRKEGQLQSSHCW